MLDGLQGGHLGTIEEATLTRIKRHFAGREAAVAHAFAASESFRGLCRDYVACTNALARWQASDSEEASQRTAEYSELLDELTQEIESRLEARAR